MKKITIVLDGSADRQNALLDGKTPLEYANTPNLDALFKKSLSGVVKTIPDGMEVGSAVANLSLLGFDPSTYKGRAVIEASGLNMPIDEDDMYIRVNMVNFEGNEFEESHIKSYSAFDIPTEEAEPLAKALKEAVYTDDRYQLEYCGSFRNILIVKGGAKLYPIDFMPAHDIIGQPIAQFIETEGIKAPFFDLMKRSFEFLKPYNAKANGVWFWGASIMPDIKGETQGRVALSETLLMDGITKISGIDNIGTIREGKTFEEFLKDKLENAISALDKYDDLYIHIQETDDLSHELMPKEKAQAIEAFDRIFLPAFLEAIKGDYSIKLSSDHFTFSDTGAHGGEPVPFLYFRSYENASSDGRFTEKDCLKSKISITAKELRNR